MHSMIDYQQFAQEWNKELAHYEEKILPFGTITYSTPNDSIEILKKTLQLVQRVTQNIADFLEGNDSKRGKIAQSIRQENKYYIKAIHTHLLKIIVGNPMEQISLLESTNPMELLIDLLQFLHRSENGKDVLYSYNLRIFNSIKRLLSHLIHHYQTIEFAADLDYQKISFTQEQLQHERNKLRFQVKDYEELETIFRGKIIAVHHQKKALEIMTDAGLKILYIVPPAFKTLPITTQKEVRVRAQRIFYRLSNNEEVTVYTVLALHDLKYL
ncbi:hypothetical protein [Allofustis seminis]|uniref:hypothetical protein n=1 Tax=Allofustis seminis TaxID=166939 RepID=UPI00036F33CC|nr:hypothetical protein [Allofustis seminis]